MLKGIFMSQKPLFNRTSILESNGVAYKMECHQPSGSFKQRGLSNLMLKSFENGQRSFVCSSGGNAGLTAAHVAKELDCSIQIFLPVTTNEKIKQEIEKLGATVHQEGRVWKDADLLARNKAEVTQAVYVHPFDHQLIWEGHSTLIKECNEQMDEPDEIYVSVGGGGLLMGVLLGIESVGWSSKVIAVETEGANCYELAAIEGKPVSLSRITSIAKSLGADRIPDKIWNKSVELGVVSRTVTDDQAIMGVKSIMEEFNCLVDPACGAAYAAALSSNERKLVVLCGGRTFSMDTLLKMQL
jgi:L-serine/L-threonine ammonia-lyase